MAGRLKSKYYAAKQYVRHDSWSVCLVQVSGIRRLPVLLRIYMRSVVIRRSNYRACSDLLHASPSGRRHIPYAVSTKMHCQTLPKLPITGSGFLFRDNILEECHHDSGRAMAPELGLYTDMRIAHYVSSPAVCSFWSTSALEPHRHRSHWMIVRFLPCTYPWF